MEDDPVVAEIRRIREELAARFNYDIHAIFEYAKQRDAADDRKLIRLPPRRPEIDYYQPRPTSNLARS